MPTTVKIETFGTFQEKQVNKYTITDDTGMQVSVINYGATVTNILVPNNSGVVKDILLGFETLEGYFNASDVYMGSICGRYANRIADGKFTVNKHLFQITKNEGENTLHGGNVGFDKVFWDATILPNNNGVTFAYNSKDGEEGFPGNLNVLVTYRLVEKSLYIEYQAKSDKATPINLTSHCYFNLSGGEEENIFNHLLQLHANSVVLVDDENIPSGTIASTKNTSMDFSNPQNIGTAIKKLGGYDYSWVLDNSGEMVKAATLTHPSSGITMEVHTTYPGIHFYSGNFLGKELISTKNGVPYKKHGGLCLEAQHFPDSPNQSHFPNTILQPNETYNQTTIYHFK